MTTTSDNLTCALYSAAKTARNTAIQLRQTERLAAGELILPDSSYAQGFTTAELDMRRKIEVLQYRATNQAGTNDVLFSRVQYPGVAALRYEQSVKNCTIPLIATPSNSTNANVPGPAFLFTYNDAAPLYNYTGIQAND